MTLKSLLMFLTARMLKSYSRIRERQNERERERGSMCWRERTCACGLPVTCAQSVLGEVAPSASLQTSRPCSPLVIMERIGNSRHKTNVTKKDIKVFTD